MSPHTTRPTEERLARILRAQSLLTGLARDLGPGLSLDAVLATVVDAMRSLLDVTTATVWLLDGRDLVPVATHPAAAVDRIPAAQGEPGRCLAGSTPRCTPDGVLAPLVSLGQTVGVLQVDVAAPEAVDDDDVTAVAGAATLAAGAIESTRRFEEVMLLERLKSDFVSRVSHELQTPVTIVSGFVSTLLEQGDNLDPATTRGMLERVGVAAARLSILIDDLLMVTRIQAGGLIPQVEPIAVRPVLEQVRDGSVAPASVTIECEPDIVLETDPDLVRRALGCLVDNALKYVGDAVIRAGQGWLEVRDHGAGVPDHLRDVVFERFTRGDQVVGVPGLGNGLPIARTIFDALGADLQLGLGEGGGVLLRVELPT